MAVKDGEPFPMPIAALAIDCADPPGLARWWQRLLGGDIEIDDEGVLDAATEQALALGATLAGDVYSGDRWRVLRDPEGNEFCILRPIDDPAR